MKKCRTLVLLLLLVALFSSCGVLEEEQQPLEPSAIQGAIFPNGILVEKGNRWDNETDICLTGNQFFYVTIDHADTNSFCNAQKLMMYDLKTGKTSEPIAPSVPLSDIENMVYIKGILYFTAYANTEKRWGFCLFAYDTDTGGLVRIFETPNTVNSISVAVCGDKLYYFASENTQEEIDDGNKYSLYLYQNGKGKIIKENMGSDLLYFTGYNDKGACFETDDSIYFLNANGQIQPFSQKQKEALFLFEEPEEDAYSSRYGKYVLTHRDRRPPSEAVADACGYEYETTYYLYDTKLDAEYPLANAVHWYGRH